MKNRLQKLNHSRFGHCLVEMCLLALVCVLFTPSNAFWAGGAIAGSRYGAIGAGGTAGSTARVGSISSVYPASRAASLPSGMINVNGEIVDTINKVIQKVSGMGGTQYYSYLNQKTGPIFQTPTVDTGKHFVLFQDVNYPPGDGHYIVLKRWRGMPLGGTRGLGGAMYEAYYLDLGDSINALVSNWNMASYMPMGINGMSYGAYGGGMGYYGRRTPVRMTRASDPDEAPIPPPLPPAKAAVPVRSKPKTVATPARTVTITTTTEAPEKEEESTESMEETPDGSAAALENGNSIEEAKPVTEPGAGAGGLIVSEETTELLKVKQ